MKQNWLAHDNTGSVEGSSGQYLMVLGQYVALLVGTWLYWVSLGRYWLVLGDTGSVWGGTGWYLVVLGQCNLVLLDIKWNWVSTTLLCLYILKKSGDLVGCHHSRTTTEKGKIELLSQWTMDG